jgi:hypothetical protein
MLETNLVVLASDLDAVLPNPLYGGTILLWSGPAKSIPAGWVLCDGANGTPDLRNRFIRGASGAGVVGEAGGSAVHTHLAAGHEHPVPALGHVHSIDTMDDISTDPAGDHTHEVGTAIGNSIHVDQLGFGGVTVAAEGHTHTLRTSRPAWHRHVLNIPGTGTVGTTSTNTISIDDSLVQSAGNLPPYYALCYIMKLPEKPSEGWIAAPGADLSSRVSALAQTTATLGSHLKSAVSGAVPLGLIAFWSGLSEALPESWEVCDGANSTPDLRNRFVLGASGSLVAGDEGGNLSHAHTTHAHSHQVTMPFHTHAIASVSTSTHILPGHTHTFGSGEGDSWPGDPSSDRYEKASLESHSHILSVAGAHSHPIALPATSTERKDAAGWTGLVDSSLVASGHLPPYLKLSYLMKREITAGSGALKFSPAITDTLSRVEALEKAATELSQAANQAALYTVPAGVIAIWPGTTDSVPTGWTLCNGLAGTPDLRGRFVLGAADAPGLTGGGTEHNHSLGLHSHTVSFPHIHGRPARELRTRTVIDSEHSILDYETGHVHSFLGFSDPVSLVNFGDDVWISGWMHGHDLGGETAHEHDVTMDQPLTAATSSLHSTSSEATYAAYEAEHLPPFRRMLFIMKTNAPPDAETQWVKCESIAVSAGQVRLTWPSVAGRRYAVEHTPTLVTVPFSCIASNLPAVLPRNLFVDDLRPPKGFYRLREEP